MFHPDHDDSAEPGPQQALPIDPLEIRSNPRVGTDLPVQIYAGEFGGALSGRSRDLSIGGVCVATPSPFSYKSVQRVSIMLTAGQVTLDAVGCWQREDPQNDLILTGLSFDHPAPEVLEHVWDHVLDTGKTLARFLYEHTALQELGLEEAMGLAQVTRYRSLRAGETIYRQGSRGDENDSIFLIIEGRVTLQIRIRDAIEQSLARLEAGALFGGLPLLADLAHAETAVADQDVRLLELDRAAFRHLRSMKPWLGHRLGVALLRVHAERLASILGLASRVL